MTENLSRPVHFQNEQWAVTRYGIECVNRTYPIEANRLGESWDETLPDWPRHLAGKNWVKDKLFLQAFMVALSVHAGRYKRRFKEVWYVETKRYIARKRKGQRLFDKALDIVCPKPRFGYDWKDLTAARKLIDSGGVK